ncbi:MAG: SURF1 family protein, partial [Candidatus Competibacterales bacterium]|nr:SURF1 family protein [Candidatus Competibacterales bacterium]
MRKVRPPRRFRPRFVPTLATALLLPLLLGLGFWQLDRAQQKQALQDTFAQGLQRSPVALTALDPAAPENRYRPVEVTGRYDADHQLLLDNRIRAGRPGYEVYTPLYWGEPRRVILVNRGWVPLGGSRNRLPEIGLQGSAVTVRGRLSQPANPGIRMGEALAAPGWPKVVPYIDYAALSEALGTTLTPAVLLLDPAMAQGYRRDWSPEFGGLG